MAIDTLNIDAKTFYKFRRKMKLVNEIRQRLMKEGLSEINAQCQAHAKVFTDKPSGEM